MLFLCIERNERTSLGMTTLSAIKIIQNKLLYIKIGLHISVEGKKRNCSMRCLICP